MLDDLTVFSFKTSVVLSLAILTAWGDLLHYRISNRSVLLTLSMGLAWSACNCLWSGVALGIFGVLVGFVLLVPFYALGGVTAGDVKWLAALGAWYGPRGILGVFLLSSILLGVFCLVSIAYGCFGKVRASVSEDRGALEHDLSVTQDRARIDDAYGSVNRRLVLIPYAVPVAIGILMIESYRAMGA